MTKPCYINVQASDGRRPVLVKLQKLAKSGKAIGEELEGYPNEEGLYTYVEISS